MPRLLNQLKCGTRGQEKASQASDYMLISMREMAVKWLYRIGVRTSPGCELCKRERRKDMASLVALPEETVAHIQSAGCKAQKKSVIGDHNRCWGYLRVDIFTHGEAKRNLEFIEGDQDRQLKQLWAETGICDILGGY